MSSVVKKTTLRRNGFYTIPKHLWLSWVLHSRNINLQIQYNGHKMALGIRQLLVDGWDSANRTSYQFHGCMFHGHLNCALTKGREFHSKTDTPLMELFVKTIENLIYLEGKCNVQVVPAIWQFLDKTFEQINHHMPNNNKNNTYGGSDFSLCQG